MKHSSTCTACAACGKLTHSSAWVPKCAGLTNRRSSLTEPEIWFRIVHITPELRDLRQGGRNREQTVEIPMIRPEPENVLEPLAQAVLDAQVTNPDATVADLWIPT